MLQIPMPIFSVFIGIVVSLTGCSQTLFPPRVHVSYGECENIRLGSTNAAFLEALNCLSQNNRSIHSFRDYVMGLSRVDPESESLIQLILGLQKQNLRRDFHEVIRGVGESGLLNVLSQFLSDLDTYSQRFHNGSIIDNIRAILQTPSHWEKASSFFKSDFLYWSIRKMAHTVPSESFGHILNRKWEHLFQQRHFHTILQSLATESLINVLKPMSKDLKGTERFIHTLGSGDKHTTPIFIFSGLVQFASTEVRCPRVRRNIPSYLNFLETQFQQRMSDGLAMRRFTMIEIPVFSTFVIQNCNVTPVERQGLQNGLQSLGQIVKSKSHGVLSLFLTAVKEEWGDFSKIGDIFNKTSAPFLEFFFSSITKANVEEDFVSALSDEYTYETHGAFRSWVQLLENEDVMRIINILGAYRDRYPVQFVNHLEELFGALQKALQSEYSTLYSLGHVLSKVSELVNLESQSGLYFVNTVQSEAFREFFDSLYTLEKSGELSGLLGFILEVNGYDQHLKPKVVRLPRVSLPKEESEENWGSGYHRCYQLRGGLFGSVDDFQRVFECFNADNEVPHLNEAIYLLKDNGQLDWFMNFLRNKLLVGTSFDQFISKLERDISSGEAVEFAKNLLNIPTSSRESLLLEDYFKDFQNSKQILWAFLSVLNSSHAPTAFEGLRELQALDAITPPLAVNRQIFYRTYGLFSEDLVQRLIDGVERFIENEHNNFLSLLEFKSEEVFGFLQSLKKSLSHNEIEKLVYGIEWAVSDLQKVKYWYGPEMDDYVEKTFTPLQRIEILMEVSDLELWPWLEPIGLGAEHFGTHAMGVFLNARTSLEALRSLKRKMEIGQIILKLSKKNRQRARNLKENFDILFEFESRGLTGVVHHFLKSSPKQSLNPFTHSQLIKHGFLGLHILYSNKRLKSSLRGLLTWLTLQSEKNLFVFSKRFSDYKKLIDLRAIEMNRLDALLTAAPFIFTSPELIGWAAKNLRSSQDISFLIEDISQLQNLRAKHFYELSYWFYDLIWSTFPPLDAPLIDSVVEFVNRQDIDVIIHFLRSVGSPSIKSFYQIARWLDTNWKYEEVNMMARVLNILAKEGLLQGLIIDIKYLIRVGEARRIVEMFIDNFVPVESEY